MEFKIFKRKNKENNSNTLSENNILPSEKQLLISEIGEDKIEDLCSYNSIEKDELSLHLLTILKNNLSVLEQLKNIFDKELLRKINDNTLTLEDIPTYKLNLLDLPIFNDTEQRRINLLKKQIKFKNSNYSYINSDSFIDKITTDEVVDDISSHIENIKIKKVRHLLPVYEGNSLKYYDSKFTYVFIKEKDEYDEETALKFDENTIIITDYNTFLELTKDNIDLVEKYNFVLENNYEVVKEIEKKVMFNTYNDKFFKPSFDNVIKINHLLYLVDNSNMEIDRKRYYSYYFKKIFFSSEQFYSYNNKFLELVKELTKELDMDYISETTDTFNNLTLEDKIKRFEQDEFDVSIFITSLGNLDDISSMELIKKIYWLTDEQKELIYNDTRIKNKLKIGLHEEADNDLYRYYGEVIKNIEPKDFLNLYKNEGISKYFKKYYKNEMYKIFACLCEKSLNETVKYVLEDEKLFDEFFKLSDNFYSMFYNLDYELLKEVIFKMERNDYKYKFDFLSSVSYDNQIKLFNEEIKDKTILKMIPFMRLESVNYFFENNLRARHLYKHANIAYLINCGVKFNIDILKNRDFFDELKNSSLINFRNNINNVEKYNDPTYIEERLKEYYEELISSYNSETKIFKDYEEYLLNRKEIGKDKSNDYILSADVVIDFGYLASNSEDRKNDVMLIEYLRKVTSKKISEIVIDSIFQDNIYNVWLNINEMIRYNEKLSDSEKVLDKEKLEFYKLILDFDNIDSDKKIEIYNKLKDKNYNLIFYEDLRKLKDLSYDMIQKDMLKPMEHPEYLDKDSTLKHGVDIYDLRDREYTILVRRESTHQDKTHTVRNCYSLISNENSQVFGGTHWYLYGYNTIEKDRILHILETDSFSSSVKDDASKYVNRIMTSKEIVNSDSWYSEIQIVNTKNEFNSEKYDAKKPDFIVVFDSVFDSAIEEGKRLNIPIVIINDKKLDNEKKTGIELDRQHDIYIIVLLMR